MKRYDVVILLSGNSYFGNVPEDQVDEMNKTIFNAVDGFKPSEKFLSMRDGNRVAMIRKDAILGWYFKPHEASVQEKVLKTLEKAIDPPEDDWKRQPEE